ncbi:lysostaphin resistance A-like protein [Vibrio sp. WXL210]|uniref:CPBP family intramembrane glutamic endopeptidase n=1 Tax=Vibrio sp. WXL210 TaxID=3450709 RepID=UPI003EC69B57
MIFQQIIEIPFKLWALLTAGPMLFFVGFVGVSVWLSVQGVPASKIPVQVPTYMPHILLGVLSCLFILMALLAPKINEVWSISGFSKTLSDAVLGVFVGALLALAYIYWLAPFLEVLQRTFGDYVPPGSVLTVVSGSIGLFFVANVILAPLVEETLYRGIAISTIESHLGITGAIVLSCLFFGLLHWAGGVWYMVLTGVVAGGIFAGLYYQTGSIVAPFTAHLALNLIEFVYAYRIQEHVQQV